MLPHPIPPPKLNHTPLLTHLRLHFHLHSIHLTSLVVVLFLLFYLGHGLFLLCDDTGDDELVT
jgi:hypothetical protein